MPEDRPEDAPAVEREGGQQVEDREHQVQEPEVRQDDDQRRRRAGALGEHARAVEQGGERAAHDRSGDGHQELRPGVRRLAAELGDAAEDEEGDAADRHVEAPGDQRMRQFVQDQRCEEEDRADKRHGPVGRRRLAFQDRGKDGLGERPDDDRHEDQPGRVHVDVEAEKAKKRDLSTEHRTPTNIPSRALRCREPLGPPRFRSRAGPRGGPPLQRGRHCRAEL